MIFKNLKPTWKKVISTSIVFIFLLVYTLIKTLCNVRKCTNLEGCCYLNGYKKFLIVLTIIVPIFFYILVSYYEFKNKK